MKQQGAYLWSSVPNRNPFFLEYYNTWRRGQANARLYDTINRRSKDLRTHFDRAVKACERLIRHFAKDTIIPRYCMYTDGSQTLAMYAAAVPRAARSCTKFLCFLGERYCSGPCVNARPQNSNTYDKTVNVFLSRNQAARIGKEPCNFHRQAYATLRNVTLRYFTLLYLLILYVTLLYVTLRYRPLRHLTLHSFTLLYFNLCYITPL